MVAIETAYCALFGGVPEPVPDGGHNLEVVGWPLAVGRAKSSASGSCSPAGALKSRTPSRSWAADAMVTATRSRRYSRVLPLISLSREANTAATLAPMKPKAILATALLTAVVVVAIIVAWIIWRPEVMGL